MWTGCGILFPLCSAKARLVVVWTCGTTERPVTLLSTLCVSSVNINYYTHSNGGGYYYYVNLGPGFRFWNRSYFFGFSNKNFTYFSSLSTDQRLRHSYLRSRTNIHIPSIPPHPYIHPFTYSTHHTFTHSLTHVRTLITSLHPSTPSMHSSYPSHPSLHTHTHTLAYTETINVDQ